MGTPLSTPSLHRPYFHYMDSSSNQNHGQRLKSEEDADVAKTKNSYLLMFETETMQNRIDLNKL